MVAAPLALRDVTRPFQFAEMMVRLPGRLEAERDNQFSGGLRRVQQAPQDAEPRFASQHGKYLRDFVIRVASSLSTAPS